MTAMVLMIGPKVRVPAPASVQALAVLQAYSRALVCSPFQALGRWSPLAGSWRRPLALLPVV